MIKRHFVHSFVMAAALSVTATVAQSATVSPLEGAALVNTGDGFQRISGPTEVAPGTLVTVQADSVAEIAYAPDCIVEVQPGDVAQVVEGIPCQAAAGQAAAGAAINPAVVVGGAVVLGGVLALALSGNDGPSSP